MTILEGAQPVPSCSRCGAAMLLNDAMTATWEEAGRPVLFHEQCPEVGQALHAYRVEVRVYRGDEIEPRGGYGASTTAANFTEAAVILSAQLGDRWNALVEAGGLIDVDDVPEATLAPETAASALPGPIEEET